MSSDIVTQLGIVGGSVLAPSYIPGDFGFVPSVDAYPGYYSFYWLIPGSPPTYLQVTGTVGGSIPAYSQYDRNVQLTQNDSVLGYPAYHDVTPIYDLVYFEIDGVVYSVESNNISDSTMNIANSLTYVDVPVMEPEVPTEEPTDVPVEQPYDPSVDGTGGDTGNTDAGAVETVATETPDETVTDDTATSEDVASGPAIVAPDTVTSGETVTIDVSGVIAADLSASSGTFTLTDDRSIAGAEPSSFEWIAPETEKGRTVTFKLTDPDTNSTIATAKTRVEPIPDDQIPVVADDMNCPAQISMGSMGGIEIKGSGQLIVDASDGTFPDLGPNPTFASNGEVDGSVVLQGVIRKNKRIWVFWEPVESSEPYTAYIFLQDWSGNTLLECGIDVVLPEEPPTYPEMGPQDGTGSVAGVGVATNANVNEGTVISSSDMPALGEDAGGTPVALDATPPVDESGNTQSTSGAISDGTLVEEPVASETPSS